MSNPINPLSKYRTYSYYHALAVCDSTQTAEELSSSLAFGDAYLSRPPSERLEVRNTKSGGKYLVLINGLTDAEFVIQSLSWATVVAPDSITSEGSGMGATTVELDGEMKILEPYGINFLEAVPASCDALERDPINVVWLVKTFFIGHLDDGSTETISNVRPLMLLPIDVQAEFNETGAEYTIGFVGICNGASFAPYVQEIVSNLKISNSFAGQSLEYIFKTVLPAEIERLYGEERKKLALQYDTAGVPYDDTKFLNVKYEFNPDPAYKDMKFGTAEKIQTQGKPGMYILALSSNPSFTNVIDAIMQSSEEVIADCNSETEKHTYKILSAVKSDKDGTTTVTFYIQRYKAVTQKIEDTIKIGEKFTPKPGTSIEFDYIFTGQNIDIKQFDIKMEMGLAFFQTVSTTNNIPSQDESLNGILQGKGKGGSGSTLNQKMNSSSNSANRKTTLHIGGQNNKALLRNKLYPISVLNFQSMLARFAALENIQAKIVIQGNPQLLDEQSVMPSDLDKINDPPTATGSGARTEDPVEGQTINPMWASLPTFVKVNIRMPTNDDGAYDYTKEFWYDGYYMLFSVNNVFENGEFTQEIEMFSLPYGDPLDASSDSTDSNPASETTPVSGNPSTAASKQTAESQIAAKQKQLKDVSAEIAQLEQAGIRSANPQAPDYLTNPTIRRYQDLRAQQTALTQEIMSMQTASVLSEANAYTSGQKTASSQSVRGDIKDAESQTVIERRRNRNAKRN